jgi:hypothetical protein
MEAPYFIREAPAAAKPVGYVYFFALGPSDN